MKFREIVFAIIKELTPVAGVLLNSVVIPKFKRKAFDRLQDSMEEFGEFVLEQKEKTELTENKVDDEIYKNLRDAAFAARDQFINLCEKM